MGDCSVEDDDEWFFDACQETSSLSDWSSDSSDDCSSSPRVIDDILEVVRHEIWTKCPESVGERQDRFLKWTGLGFNLSLIDREDSWHLFQEEIDVNKRRITSNIGAVLREFGYPSPCIHSSNLNQAVELTCNGSCEGSFGARDKDFDDGAEVVMGEFLQHGRMHMRVKETASSHSGSIEELRRVVSSASPLVRSCFPGKLVHAKQLGGPKQKMKTGWLSKFGVAACMSGGVIDATAKPDDLELVAGMKMRKVQTRSRKKKYRELSSLYAGQEFLAHEGSISTMKFSTDGRLLASSGDDAVVRVWRVTEEERSERIDISDLDTSCLYFAINESSELASLNVDKEHSLGRMKRVGRQSDSCSVVLPSKVCHILEKPLHEFYGHSGEVLDLSWSKEGYLLSSSTDKTVRLWQVGCNRCLRVFSHSNYVTSINFNPIDENFFISGSVDGKVRIWEVPCGKVVDYISMREIVSAVSYQSDGKGAIVGTMHGNCFFYSIEDDHLHLDAQICVHGGKKSSGKRITGFQFPPSDPSKVMITSADSTVQILSGLDVICKYSGRRSSGCHVIASFTSDGEHIISANRGSTVCIWNYTNQEKTRTRAKSVLSCESFFSDNASIAIPWCGTTNSEQQREGRPVESGPTSQTFADYFNQKMLPFSSRDCFSLGRGFLFELLPKGSATWPEEKLSDSSPAIISPSLCRSEYKLLKSALSDSAHLWGLVIVTAGWDGRIRTYHNYGLPVRS